MFQKTPAASVSKYDPRLKAAGLTEEEFLGRLDIHKHSGFDFLVAYKGTFPWAQFPEHPLLQPRDGYILHYDPLPRESPLVFLAFNGELVGVFEGDNLTIGDRHQGKHLSRDLILLGFAQAPWKNLEDRKVTEDGAAALRSAYRFAKQAAQELAEPLITFEEAHLTSLKYQPFRDEHWTIVEPKEDYVARMQGGPLPTWPEEPLREWLYRHATDMEDYAFLGFEAFQFELATWDLSHLPGREAFRDEKFCDSFQDVEIRAADNPHDWLAHHMLQTGTWNTPIILLDNRPQSGFLYEPKLKTPYHLLEGHRRLSFLQGLKRLGKASLRHAVWVIRRPSRSASS